MSSVLRSLALRLGFCPACSRREILREESGYDYCDWCGWTNEPECPHGFLESEFCSRCPGGGV